MIALVSYSREMQILDSYASPKVQCIFHICEIGEPKNQHTTRDYSFS